jgi:hypothetical protein
MSTIPREVHDGRAVTPRYDYTEAGYEPFPEKGTGWLSFAAIMLGLAGIFGLIDGIVAVSKSSFYVASAHYVFSDLNTWGWILIVVGAVTLCAAFAILSRSQVARWTGITVAGLQALAQLMMIQAYPFWSLCIFAIDLLVIYGLAVYGGRRELT